MTRLDYLKKLDGIIAEIEEEIEGAHRGKVVLEKKQAQNFLDYFRELTDMYSDNIIGKPKC